jgi:hypothetical protein
MRPKIKDLLLSTITLIVILITVGCETVITIDPPAYTPQLAIHGFASRDNPSDFRLLVGQTTGIFDTTKILNDAIVSIEGPNGVSFPIAKEIQVVADTFFFSDTFFVFRYFPNSFNFELSQFEVQAGQTYTLKASYPGLPDVTATQTIPATILPDSVVFVEIAGIDQFGDQISAVDIFWRDPVGVKNFYKTRVLYEVSPDQFEGLWLESNDPSASKHNDAVTIADQIFDGESKRLRVTFYRDMFNSRRPTYIEWSCITEDTYLYGRSLNRYWESIDNPFVTPAQLYTNIKGGVGIFSLYKRNWIEIK